MIRCTRHALPARAAAAAGRRSDVALMDTGVRALPLTCPALPQLSCLEEWGLTRYFSNCGEEDGQHRRWAGGGTQVHFANPHMNFFCQQLLLSAPGLGCV